MKMNKALFLFGMLLLAAVVSAQEAVNNVQADATAMPLPNARRLNTYGKGYGYYPYGYGFGYPYGGGYPYPFYGRGYGFPGFGINAGIGFNIFG